MVTGLVRHALPAAVGILADRVWGEPPLSPHPVALFGGAMRAVEHRWYADRRDRGAAHAAVGLGAGVVAGAAIGSTAVATYVAVAGRALSEAAAQVAGALAAGDLEEARRLLPALVGRDPTGLDEKEIARAVVESVAENTVDAVVAPALWGAVGGAPGALGYRAANTMDAMVGYHSQRYERYGWACARLDDIVAWIPARVTALLVAAVRPSTAGEVWRTVRHDAGCHPSPNAGVAESAFAAALGLRLGGVNRYGQPPRPELRPTLGSGRPPEPGDIAAAIRLSRDVGLALAGTLATAGLLTSGVLALAGRRVASGGAAALAGRRVASGGLAAVAGRRVASGGPAAVAGRRVASGGPAVAGRRVASGGLAAVGDRS